jgi:hypothetical protein
MKVGEILRIATSEANSDPTVREDNIGSLCNHLQKVLKFHRRLEIVCFLIIFYFFRFFKFIKIFREEFVLIDFFVF